MNLEQIRSRKKLQILDFSLLKMCDISSTRRPHVFLHLAVLFIYFHISKAQQTYPYNSGNPYINRDQNFGNNVYDQSDLNNRNINYNRPQIEQTTYRPRPPPNNAAGAGGFNNYPDDRRRTEDGFVNRPNVGGDIRALLQALDVQASQQCTNNVAAQWNFETNVNEATQLEAVSKNSLFFKELRK